MNRDKRILLVTDVTGPGGVDVVLHNQARFGREWGWQVKVLLDSQPGSDRLYRQLVQDGIPAERADLYHGAFAEAGIRAVTRQVIDDCAPRVIHVHCGSPRSALFCREVALASGIPLIFTEHYVHPELSFTPSMHERVVRLYRQAFAVISVCPDNYRLLTGPFNLPAARITVIANTVPPRKGSVPGVSFDNGKESFRAVTVGRLARQKGIDILVESIRLLPPTIRERIFFTVIGDGEERQELARLVAA
jgi:glycosyltransferase involved in cell wall biosynthesis